MPSSTPIFGFPYPLGSDPVRDGADDIRDLALAVETEIDTYPNRLGAGPAVAAPGSFVAGQVLTAAELNDIGTWQDFTPTFTGITVGNGTVTARYCQINKLVFWQCELVVGSTTTIAASRISTPTTMAQVYLGGNGGQVTFEDASNVDYQGSLFRYSGTEVNIYAMYKAANDYITQGGISATVPFTWTTGDRIIIQDFYEAP